MGPTTDDFAADAPPLRVVRKGVGGRPKKADPRTEQCNIRLTPREKEIVLRRAAVSGQTEAEFARAALLAGSPFMMRTPEAPLRSPEERLLDEELRRMGVNLNQLVRHINTHPDRTLPADLQPLLATIRQHLAAVLPHGT